MFLAAFAEANIVGTCDRLDDPAAPVWSKVHLANAEALGCGTIAYDEREGRIVPHVHTTLGLKEHSATGYTSHLLAARVQFLVEMIMVEVTSPAMTRPPNPGLYDVPLLTFGDRGLLRSGSIWPFCGSSATWLCATIPVAWHGLSAGQLTISADWRATMMAAGRCPAGREIETMAVLYETVQVLDIRGLGTCLGASEAALGFGEARFALLYWRCHGSAVAGPARQASAVATSACRAR